MRRAGYPGVEDRKYRHTFGLRDFIHPHPPRYSRGKFRHREIADDQNFPGQRVVSFAGPCFFNEERNEYAGVEINSQ